MPYVIDNTFIEDLSSYSDYFDFTENHAQIITQILTNFSNGILRDTYGAHLPHITFRNPQNRKLVGDALYAVWCKCCKIGLPSINMLLVRSDTNLPGNGMKTWFFNTFGEDQSGYAAYCESNIKLSEAMIKGNMIAFRLDGPE